MPHVVERSVETSSLRVAYRESGAADGLPVLLLHGFPYCVHAFDDVAEALAGQGCRVIVPWLRGFGPTRFLDAGTPRSGQQGALGADVRGLMDALGIGRATLAGYDWGGRGACIVAALWPEQVAGLVTIGGYNIQDIAAAAEPGAAEHEHRLWYQYYFHTPRGVVGLRQNRAALCRLLWRLWSPSWPFDEPVFARTAAAFDNPDFVDVVIQSYRHRYGYAAGDPAYDGIERSLAGLPPIPVPTIVLQGGDDGVTPVASSEDVSRFQQLVRREVVPAAGHNLPQERPDVVVRAVLELMSVV